MKDKPKVYGDSWWSDLANALAMKPVYRKPISQPRASTPTPPPAPAPEPVQETATVDTSTVETTTTQATESVEDTETAGKPWAVSRNIATAATQEQAIEQARRLLRAPTRPYATEADAAFVNLQEALKNFEAAKGTLNASDKPTGITEQVVKAKAAGITPAPVQYIAPEQVRFSPTPEVKDLVSRAMSPVTKSLQPDQTIRRRLRQVLKPSGQKLDRRQLKDLGLSPQEAAVAEGLFKGWNIYRIAMRTGTTQPRVNALISHMLTKFDVKQTHTLLKVLLAMHQDRKPTSAASKNSSPRSRTTNIGGIGGVVLRVDDAAYPVIIPKPPILRIPKNHPDHPLNDTGYGFAPKPKAEPKREPAHRSDDPQI